MRHNFLKATLIAAAAMTVFSSVAEDRIHELVIDSDEEFVEDIESWAPSKSPFSGRIVVNDISTITFDIEKQTMSVYGGRYENTAIYDLSKLNGFSFTYLDNGKLPSPRLDPWIWSDHTNTVVVDLSNVEDASGYEVAYTPTNLTDGNTDRFDWITDPRTVHVKTDPDMSSVLLKDLKYATSYVFAAKALSPKGEAYDSEWSIRCNFRCVPFDRTKLVTLQRGNLPNLISIRNVTSESFSVYYMPVTADASLYDKKLQSVDGKYVFDKLVVRETLTGDERVIPVTADDFDNGCITVDNLKASTPYSVALCNSSLPECDAYYTWHNFKTKFSFTGDPYLLEHTIEYSEEGQKYQACNITYDLYDYFTDRSLPQDQVFYLEGGKTYYINESIEVLKGFTLCTDPADLAAGKAPAKLYDLSEKLSSTWILGSTATYGAVDISKIVFKDIDFDCPEAVNCGQSISSATDASGNYFINTLSSRPQLTIEDIELSNCTFQGYIRGFFRMQGPGVLTVDHITIGNNVFMNDGYYRENNSGYAFFEGAGIANENFCKDVRISDNTFYDCQWTALIRPAFTKTSVGFNDDTHWNISIENNTFINFSSRATRQLVYTRTVPGGSKLTIRNNLFALASDEADNRSLYFSAIDLRSIEGSGSMEFDIRDNYLTGCREAHLTEDGIYSSNNNRFSSTRNAPGAFTELLGANTSDDLIIHTGSTPLRSTQLFADPNPRYHATAADDADPTMHSIDPEEIWTRLRYNDLDIVKQHEIYTKNIGDQRWKSANPRFYVPD